MPVHALNLQDVGKNINVGFFTKENTMNGIEISLQTLLENSISGSSIHKIKHEPCDAKISRLPSSSLERLQRFR